MIRLVILLLLLTTSAFAQQPQQPPTPEVQALLQRIQQEVQGSINCSIGVATLQQENAKLKKEIEELKAKGDKDAK